MRLCAYVCVNEKLFSDIIMNEPYLPLDIFKIACTYFLYLIRCIMFTILVSIVSPKQFLPLFMHSIFSTMLIQYSYTLKFCLIYIFFLFFYAFPHFYTFLRSI